jgi:hypothetical protein
MSDQGGPGLRLTPESIGKKTFPPNQELVRRMTILDENPVIAA